MHKKIYRRRQLISKLNHGSILYKSEKDHTNQNWFYVLFDHRNKIIVKQPKRDEGRMIGTILPEWMEMTGSPCR